MALKLRLVMVMTIRDNIREAREIRQRIQRELNKIPKKNRAKFAEEYYQLIKKAQQNDYCESK